jgi:hypothetical protein
MAQSYFVPQKRKERNEGEEVSRIKKRPSLLPALKNEIKKEKGREYAGEFKGNLLEEVFEYLNFRKLPEGFVDTHDDLELKEQKRKFLDLCQGFFISKGFLSDISQSKFGHYVKENNQQQERIIPFFDEVNQILETLHVKDGTHLKKKKCLERAAELKVYWKGYNKDIVQHIKMCHCEYSKEKKLNEPIFKRKKLKSVKKIKDSKKSCPKIKKSSIKKND